MRVRTPNLFEKILLIMGVIIILFGYSLVHRMFVSEGFLSWNAVHAIFLWLILIGVVILVAVCENMKEELRVIIEKQAEETRLLREDLRRK